MREIILRFEILTVLFTEELNYCAVETLGDLQSTSRGLNPAVKM
jgi:hypothetical protein